MSFSVDLLSDMHPEFHDDVFDYAAHKKNDIAVIAGDLGSDLAASLAELKKIAAVYETVLFVDGNHEFRTGAPDYKYNFDFEAVEDALRKGIAEIPNVVYLRDKPFVKDGVAIIGRNGHWDYKIVDGLPRKRAIKEGHSLLRTNFNNAASISKLARRDYYALRDQVLQFNQDPSIHTIVVVTHTVPRVELLNFKEGVPLAKQAQMGSGLMRNLPQYDAGKKLKFWLFGHQHDGKKQTIDSIVYQENPRGFPKENPKNYSPSVVKFGA